MNVVSWERFPDELRAALSKRYAAITWRVTLNQGAEVNGVTVGARRDGMVTQIWVPAVALEPLTLHELLEESFAEFRRRVPSVHSAGFFDEKRELGAADWQSGPAAEGNLTPDHRSTATSTVEKRRLSTSILRPPRRVVKLQMLH